MTNTNKYIEGELLACCPVPADKFDFFRVQIKSCEGHSTKWLNITPEQFKAIEQVLLERMA